MNSMKTNTIALSVLHLVPTDGIGGVPTVVATLIKSTQSVCHHVAGHRDASTRSALAHAAGVFFEIDMRTFSCVSLLALRSVIRNNDYNIVHCHGRGAALYGFLATRLLRWSLPALVYTFHGFNASRFGVFSRLYRSLEKRFARGFQKRIVLTESERFAVYECTKDPHRNLVVVPNGIMPPSCEPVVAVIDGSRQRYRFVSAGRLGRQKDYETLLRAVAAVPKEIRVTFSVHVFGSVRSVVTDVLRFHWRLRNQLGLRRTVFFYGEVPRIADNFCLFDAFISTSTWEGQPTALIEAGMAGLPAVATSCQGNVNVVQDGVTGFLATPRDCDSVASAIVKQIKANTKELGRSASMIYRSKYSVEEYAKKTLEQYYLINNSTGRAI